MFYVRVSPDDPKKPLETAVNDFLLRNRIARDTGWILPKELTPELAAQFNFAFVPFNGNPPRLPGYKTIPGVPVWDEAKGEFVRTYEHINGP